MKFHLHSHRPCGRRFPVWALLLSAALHLGLVAALDRAAVNAGAPPDHKPPTAMVVKLKASDGASRQAGLATDSALPPANSASHATSTLQPAPASTARTPDSPGSRYVEAGEWTDAPVLLQDIAADQMLVSSALTAHPLVIRLFVNEQGNIDKVEIEGSAVPVSEQQVVKAAFAEVRFQPARLRGVAVKSSLKIELKLENARMEPAPAQALTELPST